VAGIFLFIKEKLTGHLQCKGGCRWRRSYVRSYRHWRLFSLSGHSLLFLECPDGSLRV